MSEGTMDDSSSPLTNLPGELVENVVQNLDVKDISALRLTCRYLRDQSLHHFKHAYFTSRQISLSRKSLGEFDAILKHPHFGPMLQHLTVQAHLFSQSMPLGIIACSRSTDRERRLALQQLATSSRLQMESRELWYMYQDRDLLEVALAKVKSLRTVTLQYIEFDYEGRAKGIGRDIDPACQNKTHIASHVFTTVLGVLASLHIKIQKLDIYDWRWGGFVDINEFDLRLARWEDLAIALTPLRSLKLSVSVWNRGILNDVRGIQPQHLAWFLTMAPAVEELDLSLWSDSFEMPDETQFVFQRIARTAHMRFLKRCSLRNMIVRKEDFESFLSHSKGSLRYVELDDVTFRGASRWEIRAFLNENFALDNMELPRPLMF